MEWEISASRRDTPRQSYFNVNNINVLVNVTAYLFPLELNDLRGCR
jgi:hypothetical protein